MATVTAKPPAPEPDLDQLIDFPLAETDDQNLDTFWHRAEIDLMIDCILNHFKPRTDFYVGGNMFVYFSQQQARDRDYRGPDFFFVKNTTLHPMRKYWVVWLEQGKYPNFIIELLSPKTAHIDRTVKKKIYEETFRTPEYFCYDPDSRSLEGWRLDGRLQYQPVSPDERGWLWSEELGLWVGPWTGPYQRTEATWLRFYDRQGRLAQTEAEAAQQHAEQVQQHFEQAQRHSEQAEERAKAAEAEVARLTTLLEQKISQP